MPNSPKLRGLLRQFFDLRIGPHDPLPTHTHDGRPLYYRSDGASAHTYCPDCARHAPVSIVDTYEASSWPETSAYRLTVKYGLRCWYCGLQMVPRRDVCDGCPHVGEDVVWRELEGVAGFYCDACFTGPASASKGWR